MHNAADNSAPDALASMLEVERAAGRVWGEQDLAAILRHQLASPLPPPGGGSESAAAPGGARTFGELLHHPSPRVESLVAVKDFAKASRADPDAALPGEVAAVVYFAAIAVARRQCGRIISGLSEGELAAGLQWVRAQDWVDPATRALL